MIEIGYTPAFSREFKKLDYDLAQEVVEKIEIFKDLKNHDILKVHKLNGRLKDRYSFSVNYKIRIVFHYVSKNEVILVAVGDHDVYK